MSKSVNVQENFKSHLINLLILFEEKKKDKLSVFVKLSNMIKNHLLLVIPDICCG